MGIIDDVKQKVDIVDLIGQYVPLKKAGNTFKALCPFHTEKTPSFIVSPERQSWHCFGSCSTGGDIFSFVMKMEKLDFPEALKWLADKAGIDLVPRVIDQSKAVLANRLFEIHELASHYFHHLLCNTAAGKDAKDYLAGRGVTSETIKVFEIGYSQPQWDGLAEYLVNKGISSSDAVDAGLLVTGEDRGVYDRFRHRIVFPIRDIEGRLVGFGGRAMDETPPKYLNSPQTAIFDKSSVLYGIDRARKTIRQKDMAIIVEGYMDVVIAHQNGMENVIASLGTALTEKQIAILKKLTKNITLAMDADAAGEKATLRGLSTAREVFDQRVVPVPLGHGLIRYEQTMDANVRILVLPPGKDPDEVMMQDLNLWHKLLDESLPIIDYLWEKAISKLDLTNPKDKSKAVEQLSPIIAEIKDRIQRAHYIQRLARLIQVDEKILQQEISMPRRLDRPAMTSRRAGKTLGETDNLEGSRRKGGRIGDPTESRCLSLLLRYPELRESGLDLSPDVFLGTEYREIFLAWQESESYNGIGTFLVEELREVEEGLLARKDPAPKELEAEFFYCVDTLLKRSLKQSIRNLNLLVHEARTSGDMEGATDLSNKAQDLTVSLNDLYQKKQARLGRHPVVSSSGENS